MDDDLQSLYAQVQRGEASGNQLAETAAGIVPRLVERAIDRAPGFAYLRDDLVSEANLELCKLCVSLPPGIKEVAGYLAKALDRVIQDRIATEDDPRYSPRHQRRLRAKRKKVVKAALLAGVEPPPEPDKFAVEPLTDGQASDLSASNSSGEVNTILAEILEACCDDETDRAIVLLRREDRTDAEVGERLNLNASTIAKRRKAIERRYAARNADYSLGA